MEYYVYTLILYVVCFRRFTTSSGFGQMIKRGLQHHPIANRTAEDFQMCQQKKGLKKEEEAILMIEGNRLLLSCPLCLPPEINAEGVWRRFLPSAASLIPVHLDGRRSRVLVDLTLEIVNTWIRDTGIYLCQYKRDVYAKYSIDVKEDEPHRYVVLAGRKGARIKKDVVLKEHNLLVTTAWSEWSECNRCGPIGKRRRIGICTVKKLNSEKPTTPVDTVLLSEYKRGIPCRSVNLPKDIRELEEVKSRKSEFVIAFCKVPCPTVAGIVVITDKEGNVIDTVDNSKGIYSMHQPLPPLPALARRETIYEPLGKSIILMCPGNTEGKFLIWRNDSYVINPSKVHIRTKGRVKIDMVNNLHIRQLRFSDATVYSCWDDKRLVGTIRLYVTEKLAGKSFRLHILNLGVLFTFLTIFMIGLTVCKNVTLKTKE